MCPNGHFASPVQEAPYGAQVVRDLRSPYTVVSLKAGEHEF
jgi:hypothetical protein